MTAIVVVLIATVGWLVLRVLDLSHQVSALRNAASKPQVLPGDEWKQGHDLEDD